MNENISKIKFDIIIKYADLLCPNIYNSKYDNSYYLTNILLVLNDVVSWKSLQLSTTLKSKKKNHYKTIHKKHILWCNTNVYNYAFNEMINNDKNNDVTKNIIIDNTLIRNKYGSEEIG